MPKTDFEAYFPEDGDLPSDIDMFNESNIQHNVKAAEKLLEKRVEAIKKALDDVGSQKTNVYEEIDEG